HDTYVTAGGYRDGWGGTARFSYPLTISYAYSQLNAPVLFVTDYFNQAVRVVYTAIGNVPTTKTITPTVFPTCVPTSSVPSRIPTPVPSVSPSVDFRFVNVSTVASIPTVVGVAPGRYQGVSGVFLTCSTSIYFINGSGTDLYGDSNSQYNAIWVAGDRNVHGSADGAFQNGALFHDPGRMKFDASQNALFVTSDSGNTVRRLDFDSQMVTTLTNPIGNVIQFEVPAGYLTGGRYPGMALDVVDSTLFVADRRRVFNLTKTPTFEFPHAYTLHQYSALSEFAASKSWPSTYYVFGLVAVESEGMIYVTVSMSVNLLLRIPMRLSHYSQIQVLAGDSSRVYGGVFVDYATPYARDGFGSDALLAFPSSLTYDPVGHDLYFSECFTEFDDQIDDSYVGSMTIRRYSLRTGYLTENDIEEFRTEAYMMSRLRHPNIVLVMGVSIVSLVLPGPPPGFDDDDTGNSGVLTSDDKRTRSKSSAEKKDEKVVRSICIITEYLEQGSLADILYGSNKVSDDIWTYELVLTCALQAARGMLYLHSHQPPICHRDLKSSNLVVDDHWVVKVTDFGMSRIVPMKIQNIEKGIEKSNSVDLRGGQIDRADILSAALEEESARATGASGGDGKSRRGVTINEEANCSWERESMISPEEGERHSQSNTLVSPVAMHDVYKGADLFVQMTSNLGTTAWCAPELLTAMNKTRYSVKVDVYSFGMVLWELWERKRPYEDLYSRFDIIDAVREGRRPTISSTCPPTLRSLIQRCWHEQPARRPTFAYIVRYVKDELAHIKR
ncbi:SIS8, partial [Symbiodinium microadriaticum]